MTTPDLADLDLASAPPPRAPGGVNPRERGRRKHAQTHAGETCANCGAILQGPHCHICGQPAHVHRSLGHAFEEFLHGLLHLDGRTWRTLPKLFFRPGTLTRQYIDGKRADHVPPLALFLLSVFAMFTAFAFVGPQVQNEPAAPKTVAEATADLAEARAALAEAKADLARETAIPPYSGAGAEGVRAGALAAVEGVVTGLEARVRANEKALAQAQARAADNSVTASSDQPGGLRAGIAAAMASGDLTINTGSADLDKKIKDKLTNPELFLYKLQNTAYKFAFLLVPLTLPFLWLLFAWKRNVTLFDHVVFSLYSLSFVTILATLEVVLGAVSTSAAGVAGSALLFGLPVHMFFQLKGGYGLGWFSALWRLVALSLVLTVVIGLFLLAIIALGALG
jgi:hypothetical protein